MGSHCGHGVSLVAPDVLFLCETKDSEEHMDQVKWYVGFSTEVRIDAKGLVRGLCLIWKARVVVELVEFNKI